MLIYVTFFLHEDLYNDYADEDIPDLVGDLHDADIPDTVPAEEQAASPSPTAVSPPDEAGSPSPGQSQSPSPSQAYSLPSKPARFGRRSPRPVNVTQILRLAGGLGLAAAISSADVVTESFPCTDCKVPSELATADEWETSAKLLLFSFESRTDSGTTGKYHECAFVSVIWKYERDERSGHNIL